MMEIDEDAVICDLAETYGIYDLYSLPITTIAVLTVGLRDNSRIKVKIRKMSEKDPGLDLDTILLARISDSLTWLQWAQTKDAQKGKNKPKSILEALTKPEKEEKKKINEDKPKVFSSPSDFAKEWKKLGGGGIGN